MTNHDHLQTAKLSDIDQDLKDIESFSPKERLEFIHDLFATWRYDGVPSGSGVVTERAAFESSWQHIVDQDIVENSREEREDDIVFSVLPKIPHPLDHGKSDNTIRHVGRLHPDFYTTESGAVLVPLAQGYMVEVPAERQQYYQMSMSTCSCIVGYGTEQTVVAHISLSIQSEADEVLAYMQEAGIPSDDIYVVASQTKGISSAMGMPVVDSPDYYVQRGVPQQNIIPFSHEYRDDQEVIATVTVAPCGVQVAKSLYSYATRNIPQNPYEVVTKIV